MTGVFSMPVILMLTCPVSAVACPQAFIPILLNSNSRDRIPALFLLYLKIFLRSFPGDITVHDLPVDNSIKGSCENFHRISVENGNVCIFPHFQAANAVCHATDFRRINGDGPETFLHWKSRFYRKSGTQRQCLDL